ncbi:peptide-methionine (R)-S-oxide reductase [Putridiphycobacter roseus]|uniref:peptide-methionine (R)-S-oxide reductase n=2 Tax=Putridiphycobacter roseus TaxID=2219161 RepID=A0A2W1NMM4_9FLAO|nr:peptide-methionine (R)-S-oxide reductase [Putridiphycobacter roseus]
MSVVSIGFSACGQAQEKPATVAVESKITKNKPVETDLQLKLTPADWNALTKAEYDVIVNKGTERPFTGEYASSKAVGNYLCKRCNQTLFTSESKFNSGTGWPSFDAMIADHVLVVKDANGMRSEIVCSNCKGHLGHVFYGESFTDKSTRHCVNSLSLHFVEK